LQQQVMTDYLYHDFDESWLDERLDSVTVNPERRVLVVNLMNIIKDEGTQYFYIHSHRAVGKSYIAAMLSNEVVFSLHKKAAFVNAKRLLERLRATVIEKKQEYDDMLTNLETVSLLVIDDIGSEKVTDLSIEIITSLIDTRLKNNRATILTSNYSLRELESMYSAHQLKAKRLISRLTGSFQEVYLDGLDYRKVR
jgi:DNA replication protein DnaC